MHVNCLTHVMLHEFSFLINIYEESFGNIIGEPLQSFLTLLEQVYKHVIVKWQRV